MRHKGSRFRRRAPILLLLFLLLPAVSVRGGETEPYVPGEGVETVAWISDTQHYADDFTRIYPTLTEFLRDHREELNLRYVVHTGDLVQHEQYSEEWKRAEEAMALLEDIPFGVLAGNHDIGGALIGFSRYAQRFGAARFENNPWYADSFQDNRGHADLITIGGRDYVFVYMSYKPDEEAIAYMKETFARYGERTGILCLHDYLNTDGTYTTYGGKIAEEVVKACPNVYMVLCGHKHGSAMRTVYADDDGDGRDDRAIVEMLMNYQSDGNRGGDGFLRLLQFDERSGVIRTLTYSPFLAGKNETDGNGRETYRANQPGEQAVIPMPWLYVNDGSVG